MSGTALAIWISFVSVSISAAALGWNIYRDVLLKPKLKIDFGKRILLLGAEKRDVLMLRVTNFGPGKCKIDGICLRKYTLWLRFRKKIEYGFWLPDYINPMNPRLPHAVEVGDTARFTWAYSKEYLDLIKYNQIGVSDSFDRVHWASRSQFIQVLTKLTMDFPS